MALTITEKEHWKNRISARLSKRIEALLDSAPSLASKLKEESEGRAIDALGLKPLFDELDAVVEAQKAIDERKSKLSDDFYQAVAGEETTGYRSTQYVRGVSIPTVVKDTINRRIEVVKEQMLAEHPVGKQILELQEEKENLLDTVWLATSPKQIKELWDVVNEKAGTTSTPMQQAAAEIAPTDD